MKKAKIFESADNQSAKSISDYKVGDTVTTKDHEKLIIRTMDGVGVGLSKEPTGYIMVAMTNDKFLESIIDDKPVNESGDDLSKRVKEAIASTEPDRKEKLEAINKEFVDLQNKGSLTPSEESLWKKVSKELFGSEPINEMSGNDMSAQEIAEILTDVNSTDAEISADMLTP